MCPLLRSDLFLPEKIVSDLQPGQPVEIRSDVDSEVPLMGTVDRISPAVDPSTSTVKVTLRVTDAEGKARVGSFVRARITTDTVNGAIAVPKSALVPEAGVIYLFVAEAESVLKVPVTTGYADDEFIEITGGLQLGDNVVSVGQGGLRHGSKIRDLNAPEPPADDIAADDTDTDTPIRSRGQLNHALDYCFRRGASGNHDHGCSCRNHLWRGFGWVGSRYSFFLKSVTQVLPSKPSIPIRLPARSRTSSPAHWRRRLVWLAACAGSPSVSEAGISEITP